LAFLLQIHRLARLEVVHPKKLKAVRLPLKAYLEVSPCLPVYHPERLTEVPLKRPAEFHQKRPAEFHQKRPAVVHLERMAGFRPKKLAEAHPKRPAEVHLKRLVVVHLRKLEGHQIRLGRRDL
jgi:hypothetical protein